MSLLKLNSIKQAADFVRNLDLLSSVRKRLFDREFQFEHFVERKRIIDEFLSKTESNDFIVSLRNHFCQLYVEVAKTIILADRNLTSSNEIGDFDDPIIRLNKKTNR